MDRANVVLKISIHQFHHFFAPAAFERQAPVVALPTPGGYSHSPEIQRLIHERHAVRLPAVLLRDLSDHPYLRLPVGAFHPHNQFLLRYHLVSRKDSRSMPAQHHRLRLFRKHQPFRIAAYYYDGNRFRAPSVTSLLVFGHLLRPVLLPPFSALRASRIDPLVIPNPRSWRVRDLLFSDIVPPRRFFTRRIVVSLLPYFLTSLLPCLFASSRQNTFPTVFSATHAKP